jgi:serine/threonine protein kinase
VFQVGCVLYCLLTGHPPFHKDSTRDRMYPLDRCKKTDGSGISESAQDLICKMLKNSPSERISLSEALQHPWILDGAPLDSLTTTYNRLAEAGQLRRQVDGMLHG